MLIKLTNRQMKIHKDSVMDYTLTEIRNLLDRYKYTYDEDSRHIIFTQSANTRYYILYELSRRFDIELM